MPLGPDAVAKILRETRFDVDPDPDFTERLRTRLMAVAAVQPVSAQTVPPTPIARGLRQRLLDWTRSRRLIAAMTVMSIFIAAAGLLVVASRNALPGDSIYGLKRATERAELALASSGTDEALTLLGFAENRLDEVDDLVNSPQAHSSTGPSAEGQAAEGVSALVNHALTSMDADTRSGAKILTTAAVQNADPAPLGTVGGWATQQISWLDSLQPLLPAGSAATATKSRALLVRVLERATTLQSQLTCACTTARPSDDLGPTPCAPCDAATAAGASATSAGQTPAPGSPAGGSAAPGAPPTQTAAPGQPAPGQPAPGQPAPGQPGQPAPGQPATSNPAPTPSSPNPAPEPSVPAPSVSPVPTVPVPEVPTPTPASSAPCTINVLGVCIG